MSLTVQEDSWGMIDYTKILRNLQVYQNLQMAIFFNFLINLSNLFVFFHFFQKWLSMLAIGAVVACPLGDDGFFDFSVAAVAGLVLAVIDF